MKLPSQAFLRTLFKYDPKTGRLRRARHDCTGRKVSINNTDFWAARVVWKMQTGREPRDVVDFLDGDQRNLRWANLVERTRSELRSSGAALPASTTGIRGVYPDGRGWFRAELRWHGVKHRLGTFRTVKTADAARRAKRVELMKRK